MLFFHNLVMNTYYKIYSAESPLTARRSNQSILKEINPEYSGDAEAESPVHWPTDTKSWFTEKDPDAGKDWRQEEGVTEDEMVG